MGGKGFFSVCNWDYSMYVLIIRMTASKSAGTANFQKKCLCFFTPAFPHLQA